MNSYHTRSAVIGSIASILIASMLLGSVLISNVYAKGSGVKSQNIIWKRVVRMTLKGNRSL